MKQLLNFRRDILSEWCLFMVLLFLLSALNVNAQTEMTNVTARYYTSDKAKSYLNYSDYGEPSPPFSLGSTWVSSKSKKFKSMILRWRIADQLGNVPAYSKMVYAYIWQIEGRKEAGGGSAPVFRALFESETDSPNNIYVQPDASSSTANSYYGSLWYKNSDTSWHTVTSDAKTRSYDNSTSPTVKVITHTLFGLVSVDDGATWSNELRIGEKYTHATIACNIKNYIYYDVNGMSSSTPATQEKEHTESITLSNTDLSNVEYRHTGWNTRADGTGTHYDLGATYSAKEGIKLYAEWKPCMKAANLTLTPDKFNGKMTLRWTTSGDDANHYTAGKWFIFRKRADETAYTKVTELVKASTSYTDTGLEVGVDYTYAVSFVHDNYGSIDQPADASITVTATNQLPKTFSFSNITKSNVKDGNGGIRLSWTPEKSGVSVAVEKFNSSSNTWNEIYSGTATEFTDRDVEPFAEYTYRLKSNMWSTDFYSEDISIAFMVMSEVTKLTTSRGYFSNLVKVNWEADQFGASDTRYVISRKILTDPKAIFTNIYETLGQASSYYYEDATALPGQYYVYRVTAFAKNNNTGKWSEGNSIESDGFSTSRGIISGRVSFGNGTAVEDVTVRLSKNIDDDDPTPQFYSLSSNDETGLMTWTPDDATLDNYLSGKPVSIQMWVNADNDVPASGERAFFNIKDQVTLYLKNASEEGKYEIVAKVPGTDKQSTGLTVKADVYSNITFVSDGKGNYTIFASNGIDDDGQVILSSFTIAGSAISWTSDDNNVRSMTFGANGNIGDVFVGNIDDVRVWRTALAENDIRKNHNRILAGTEANILCYWPLDEGFNNISYVYDVSKTNGVANGNHAVLSKSAVFSSIVPTDDQLSLFGITDSQGNFTIRGVPFVGEGTSYTITPIKGEHEFNPAYVTRYVSNNSLTHNAVDFSDVSSFPVRGNVMYANTTIPVEEAYVYIDGNLASKDGNPITTDGNGEFCVDVPIGDHYIQIKKEGHTFENAGRYPADPNDIGIKATFNKAVSGLIFTDQTLVTVVGRVVGGDIENDKPLGFGYSKANIGQATLALNYVGSDKYMINAKRVESGLSLSYENNDVQRDFDDATMKVNSKAYVEAGANAITIKTDPKTGEFAALLPPLKYNVSGAKIDSQSSISFANNLPSIDASNVMHTYTDSLSVDDDENYDYFTYVASAKLRYKSAAKISITENEDGTFGLSNTEVKNVSGDTEIVPLYKIDEGKIDYIYGAPVYKQLETYTYKIKAYEKYVNMDEDDHKTELVPLAGTAVTIKNEYAAEAYVKSDGTFVEVEDNTFELDENGLGYYRFKAGVPNIQAPYTRGIAISFNVDGTEVAWEHNNDFKAIVIGILPTGNNFVTAGPDKVLMVLRDPPGTGSSTTYGKGHTHTDATTTTVRASEQVGFDMVSKFGLSLTTFAGVGAGTIIHTESSFDLGFGISEQYDYESNDVVTHTVTTNEEFSTSDSPDFVGHVGDVFIGSSTNVVLGSCNDLRIFKNEDGNYELGVKQNMVASQEFDTKFAYTENNIQNILIPNLIDARNKTLQYVEDVTTVGRPATGDIIYVTSLKSDDPNYGKANDDECWGADAVKWDSKISSTLFTQGRWGGKSYTMILPADFDYQKDDNGNLIAISDQIEWYNNSVKLWEHQLYNNEKCKVDAINARSKYFVKNYSFDAGSTITVSVDSVESSEYTRSNGFDINVAFTEGWSSDVKAGTKVAYEFEMNEEVTSGGTWETTKGDEYTTSISYTLAEDGDDDYLSVDVYDAPDGFGPIFVTRGGATSAPYEGEVRTQYYNEGTIISYATLQIEKPEISIIDKIVTGVPAGKDAKVRIILRNNSETGEDCYYGLWVSPETNPDGLQIYLDGQPIMSGIEILVPAGEPMTKTLLVRQTNSDILDYKGIELSFYSTSQPDDTGIFPGISSEDSFDIHFLPSVSDIELSANTSVVNIENNDPLLLSIGGYDYNQESFKRIRLQYKGVNDANFTTLKEFVKNPDEAAADNNLGVFSALSGTEKLSLPVDLSASDYIDQTYVFRALAVGLRNGEEVTNSSEEIMVVRDMGRPQLITNPTPTNGVLSAGGNITLTFNEDINRGVLTKTGNFIVTGKMNETEVAHDVALDLTGSGAAKTTATINLAQRPFAANLWLNYSADGTILQHGTADNSFTASIRGGKLVLAIGDKEVVSTASLPTGKWVFLALNYDNSDETPRVSASYAQDADIVNLFTGNEFFEYEGNGPLTIGGNGLKAKVQEVTLWNEARNIEDALADRNKTKNPYTSGLIGYWQLGEGHGITATDRARSRDLTLPAENAWYVGAGVNYAAKLDGETAIESPVSTTATADDSYMVELWFNVAEKKAASQTIVSLGNKMDVSVNDKGQVVTTVNGTATTAYTADVCDGQWHHMAINVLKGSNGSATLYIDGQARRQFSASQMPTLGDAAHIVLGAHEKAEAHAFDQFMTGSIDELRVWNGRRTADVVKNMMYKRVENDAEGLEGYYPMEVRSLNEYGQVQTQSSVKNQKGNGNSGLNMNGLDATGFNKAFQFGTEAPALATAPALENVQFDFVASERQITINLGEEPYKMENCNVNLTVKNVKDLNGNAVQPITWTIFVQQNQLKWVENSVEVETVNGEAETFTVEIENHGATSDSWTLKDMPTWLTVNTESGNLAPQASQKLRFTVDPSTAVGNYEATVYLTGSQNIDAPLNITLKVKGEEPDWTPMPDEETMNVVAQVKVDGIVCSDPDDMLAAFRGQECVGMAKPIYSARYDAYFVMLSIYGKKESEGAALNYKFYDASTGTIYPAVTSSKEEAYTFYANAMVGSFGSDWTIFTPENKIEQDLSLNRTGWKWFSIYATPDDASPAGIFADAAGKVTTLKDKSNSALYKDNVWGGTLSKLNVNTMYKLQADEAYEETIIGAPAVASQVDIEVAPQTWTWIGYPVAASNSLASAFADAEPQDGDIVKSQSLFAMYVDGGWMGSLTAMTPGEGYKYYSTASGKKTFRYQTPASGNRRMVKKVQSDVLWLTSENNMTLIANVMMNGEIVDDAIVSVYAGEELCGYSAAGDDEGRHFITVGSTKNGTRQLRFVVETEDDTYVLDGKMDFNADAVVGTAGNPLILNLDDVTAIKTIASEGGIDRIEYYDLNGRMMFCDEHPASISKSQRLSTTEVALMRVVYTNGTVKVFKTVE